MATLKSQPNFHSYWQHPDPLFSRVKQDILGEKGWLRFEAEMTVLTMEDAAALGFKPGMQAQIASLGAKLSATPYDPNDPSKGSLMDVGYPMALEAWLSFPPPNPNAKDPFPGKDWNP